MSPLTIILIVIGIIALWLIWTFNRLIVLRVRVREALSDIDVQLKRRFNLIPNLVETVKGYIKHEREVLEKVTEARARVAQSGGSAMERAGAENALSGTLKTLFAVAENYPDLKANANFLDLQRELADTENKIQASRRFYNNNAMALNTKVQKFPVNLVASLLGFKIVKFFEAPTEEKKNIKVKF